MLEKLFERKNAKNTFEIKKNNENVAKHIDINLLTTKRNELFLFSTKLSALWSGNKSWYIGTIVLCST